MAEKAAAFVVVAALPTIGTTIVRAVGAEFGARSRCRVAHVAPTVGVVATDSARFATRADVHTFGADREAREPERVAHVEMTIGVHATLSAILAALQTPRRAFGVIASVAWYRALVVRAVRVVATFFAMSIIVAAVVGPVRAHDCARVGGAIANVIAAIGVFATRAAVITAVHEALPTHGQTRVVDGVADEPIAPLVVATLPAIISAVDEARQTIFGTIPGWIGAKCSGAVGVSTTLRTAGVATNHPSNARVVAVMRIRFVDAIGTRAI